MSGKRQNFASRVWAIYYNESGMFLFKSESRDILNFLKGAIGREMRHIPALENVDYIDDKSKTELIRAVGPKAEGIFTPVTRDVPALLSTWKKVSVAARERPILFFKRVSLQTEPSSAIIAHTCYDALFLEEVLPPSYAEIFRSSRDGIVAKDTSGVLPILDKIDAAFNSWYDSKNIVLCSDRIFSYAAFMPAPDPIKFHKIDLSRTRNEGHPYGCAIVYSLGISSDNIRLLQNMGFVWNRNIGAWAANVSKLDKPAFGSFITESSLPRPEEIGFIPEWMASRAETQALGYIYRTGSFSYEGTKRNKNTYEELVRVLMKN